MSNKNSVARDHKKHCTAALALLNGRTICGPLILILCSASAALARPISHEGDQRWIESLANARQMLSGPGTEAEKFDRLTEAVRNHRNPERRRALLALATLLPGKALESFLVTHLRSDDDWSIRSDAATLLGKFGSESAIAPLGESAAADKVTMGRRGCLVMDGTARRAAIFALAEIGRRLPGSAELAAAELRKLPVANEADKRLSTEGLGDARAQALHNLTGE